MIDSIWMVIDINYDVEILSGRHTLQWGGSVVTDQAPEGRQRPLYHSLPVRCAVIFIEPEFTS